MVERPILDRRLTLEPKDGDERLRRNRILR